MKLSRRFLSSIFRRVALAGVIAASTVSFTGYLIFNREVGAQESLVPLNLPRKSDGRGWEILVKALTQKPVHGRYRFCSRDFERVKELIVIAIHYSPPEDKGGALIDASAASIRFLEDLYPDATWKSDAYREVNLHSVYSAIRDHPPSYCRVFLLSVYPQMHASSAAP